MRKGLVKLLRGMQPLQSKMTVGGLEDGEELSLIWSKKYVEMARYTGMQRESLNQYKISRVGFMCESQIMSRRLKMLPF